MRSVSLVLILLLAGCRDPMVVTPCPAPCEAGVCGFASCDVNHILSTGQSLSIGSGGAPPLSNVQPYGNLMFNGGARVGGTGLTRFIPLVERGVETMSSAMANQISYLAGERWRGGGTRVQVPHSLLVSVHGVGAMPYSELKRGSAPFNNGLAQVAAARRISGSLGKSYSARAVTVVHGEKDHAIQNSAYDQDLLAWQVDYEQEVNARTGQREPVPMFQTQISSWTHYGDATSIIPLLQLKASLARLGRLVLVGAKYHLPYSDGVHLTNRGYQQLGEQYARAYVEVVLQGKKWVPLRPLSVAREGAVIIITFHVPAPPLVLDTTRVSDPGHRGFEYRDDSLSPPRIVKVALQGEDAVRLTLARLPTGANRRVGYAMTGLAGNWAGPTSGPRGNLRDSDDTPSRLGYKLHNWAVHFEMEVP